MDVKQERFWDLMTRWLAREATNAEAEELKRYLANPKYKELFDWMNQKWESFPETLAGPFSTEEELGRLHQRMNKEKNHSLSERPTKRFMSNRFLLRAAAIIVVLISVAGILWVNRSDFVSKNSATDSQMIVYRVGNGHPPKQFTLADDSKVWLNANSKLEVFGDFRDSARMVRLEGEAFFEVKRDTTRPFIVQHNNIVTRVLGTSFNIMAYHNEACIVAVEEGSVEVSGKTSNRVILTSNQQVYIPQDEENWKQSTVQVSRISSWRQGVIWFNDSPLEVLIPKLERRFGIKFQFKDEQTKRCVLVGKLDMDEIRGLLQGLNELFEIKYEYMEDNQLVYLYGGICN